MNRAAQSRPLRFLALLLFGWIGARAMWLWHDMTAAALPGLPPALPAATPAATPVVPLVAVPVPFAPASLRLPTVTGETSLALAPSSGQSRSSLAISLPLMASLATQIPPPSPDSPHPAPPVIVPAWVPPPPPQRKRWSASLWLAVRGNRGLEVDPDEGGMDAGELGGAQAGARIAYALTSRLTMAGRLTSPLYEPGREAALALEWRPGKLPVRLVGEYRLPLDSGSGGPGLGVITGIDTRLPKNLRLEAYGQAGAIARTRLEPYADGVLRLTKQALPNIWLGVGTWGAAQRGVQRLDLGPTLTASLPLAGRNLRLFLDWRQRLAGNAHPGSGPVLTLGMDF